MALFHKMLNDTGRELYLYYPGAENRTPFKRSSMTFLIDPYGEADIHDLLYKYGLAGFADRNDIILSFPVPNASGWNYAMDAGRDDDVAAFRRFQEAMIKPDNLPLETDASGIPTLKSMLSTWHPMNDVKYLVGVGTGASMAFTLAARYPDNIAAVLTIGGKLDAAMLGKAVYSPIPISIVNGGARALDYFIKANDAVNCDENANRSVYRNKKNPLQCVVFDRTTAST